MRIGIVGLGLMGASFAKAWSNHHHIIGFDRDAVVLHKALTSKVIHQAATSADEVVSTADVLFICLYPSATKTFLQTHQEQFRPGMTVCDIAGVKSLYADLVAPQGVNYVWTHPIAGRALSGFDAHNTQMFQGANFIITPTSDHQDSAIDTVTALAKECGFGLVTIMNPKEHDARIAYTSQLTHAIAVALMNTAEDLSFAPIVGDSYRDLTRIARINDAMWSELFLMNQQALLQEMHAFKDQFDALIHAMETKDSSKIQTLMKQSKAKRELLP